MSIYQDKKSGKWYFEAMIRGKRYHRAISEATTDSDKIIPITIKGMLVFTAQIRDRRNNLLFLCE